MVKNPSFLDYKKLTLSNNCLVELSIFKSILFDSLIKIKDNLCSDYNSTNILECFTVNILTFINWPR